MSLPYIAHKKDICNVYMGSRRAISDNIAPKPSFFSSEEGKFLRAASRARGPKARGQGLLPEGIFPPRTKKTEVKVAILLDVARGDPIYIIYIPLYIQPVAKMNE